MSVTYCLLLVLLLSLSLLQYVCDARPIVPMEKQLEKHYGHLNTRNDDKRGSEETLVGTSKVNITISSQLEATRTDNAKLDAKTDLQRPGDTKNAREEATMKDYQGGEIVKTDQSFKSVSKSWKVPHKKRPREEHPGFNLDYMQPVTHPPHHN